LGSAAAIVLQQEAFRQAMHYYGHIEGQNLLLEIRGAEGSAERLPALVDELVGLPVDVLVVSSGAAVRAAQAATRTLPIVTILAGDLVEAGHVASLARPAATSQG
jgi:putative ABC transport system substrate-binding protein